MLDDIIGGRNSGFLIQTENGTMLSPENFFRGGFESGHTDAVLCLVKTRVV